MTALAIVPSRRPALPAPAPVAYPSPEAFRHYHAVIRDAHANLPPAWAAQFPNPRGLRQHCLVIAGHCTHVDIVCKSADAALSTAARVRPSKGSDYAMVTAYDTVVTIFEAKSQSAKALPAREFYELRDKVFSILADMLGVDPVALLRQAGRSA